jgi:hypothetical protein
LTRLHSVFVLQRPFPFSGSGEQESSRWKHIDQH